MKSETNRDTHSVSRLRLGAFAGSAAISLLALCILTALLHQNFQDRLRDSIRERLRDVVALGALQIDAGAHNTLTDPADEGNATYLMLQGKMQVVRDSATGIRFVYTMRKGPNGGILFVVDAETKPEDIAHLGETYDEPGPALSKEFPSLSRPVVEDEFYTDKFGTWLSGYAPFYGDDGQRAGVMGIDISATKILAQERRFRLVALAVFGSVVPFLFLAAYWLSRRLARAAMKAQEALRESEEGFRALFAESPVSIIIHDQDTGEIIDANLTAIRSYGLSSLEALQANDFWMEPPYSFDDALRWIHKARDEGVQHFEWLNRKATGELFWEQARLNPVTINGIERVMSTTIDITERKRDEEALRKSGEEYRQVSSILRMMCDNLPELIWTKNVQGRFMFTNKACCEFLLNAKNTDEPIGKTDIFFANREKQTHPENPDYHTFGETCTGSDETVLKSGKVTRTEEAGNLKGKFVILEVVKAPFYDEEGTLIGTVGCGKDITDRKRTEEKQLSLERQVQHSQKLESLGVLAGGIAHDFNNILMTILGNADLALDQLAPHAPARENIEEIEKTTRRAADLARQMLAYSGKGRFVIEPIDLNGFVDEMAHLLKVSISKKAVLKFNYADNLPVFDGDATQIRQIIMNLITNASEAIGDKSGVIALSTGAMDCDSAYLKDVRIEEYLPAGLYVYLEVADTGCGMDRETIDKLFDPFFTTKFTGRGLGMSAVLGIVRGHKGAVKVYSEVGKGTTFKILFPATEAPGDGVAVQGKAESEGKAWRGEGTILIADDEETVCAVGKRMLERIGFTVLTAPDGREAVKVFREHAEEIVCVLLDLTMPHLDGEQVFREIRRIRADARVILCSGYNMQDATQRFAGKGFAGFLQKPYNIAMLREKLRVAQGQTLTGCCPNRLSPS